MAALSEVVPAALEGERVDRVVAMLTGLPRSEVARLVESGAVVVDGRAVRTRSYRVTEGATVEVDVPDRAAPDRPAPDPEVAFTVVHADEHVIVVDKPPGLVVHPGAGVRSGTLVNGLLARFPDLAGGGEPDRPGIVHRLDKGTSGLLVVARTEAARTALIAQLSARTVSRRYLALVRGIVESDRGAVDAPIGRSGSDRTRMAVAAEGREARTLYTVRTRYPDHALTLLECGLETGRTHQIRVHLAAIDHAVVGDARYGGGAGRGTVRLNRPFLHAFALAFDHPATGERVSYEVALPPDLAVVLDALS